MASASNHQRLPGSDGLEEIVLKNGVMLNDTEAFIGSTLARLGLNRLRVLIGGLRVRKAVGFLWEAGRFSLVAYHQDLGHPPRTWPAIRTKCVANVIIIATHLQYQ